MFTDALGNDALGMWNTVTNNGFYGGRSSDGLAIVFDPTDGFVDTFDNWASRHFGLTFDTPTTSINDVFFDGQNYHFAAEGSGRYVQTPNTAANAVPEPSSLLLFTLGLMGFGAARVRQRVVNRRQVVSAQ